MGLALNPEIDKFNSIAGKEVATPLKESNFFGIIRVNEIDSKVQRAVMYNYIINVLRQGSSK